MFGPIFSKKHPAAGPPVLVPPQVYAAASTVTASTGTTIVANRATLAILGASASGTMFVPNFRHKANSGSRCQTAAEQTISAMANPQRSAEATAKSAVNDPAIRQGTVTAAKTLAIRSTLPNRSQSVAASPTATIANSHQAPGPTAQVCHAAGLPSEAINSWPIPLNREKTTTNNCNPTTA